MSSPRTATTSAHRILQQQSMAVRAQLTPGHINPHCLVPARNIKPNRRRRDPILRGNHTANRHAIPQVPIRHQCKPVRRLRAHPRLLQRIRLMLPKRRNVINHLHRHMIPYPPRQGCSHPGPRLKRGMALRNRRSPGSARCAGLTGSQQRSSIKNFYPEGRAALESCQVHEKPISRPMMRPAFVGTDPGHTAWTIAQ